LPSSTAVSISGGGTLDLNGVTQTIGSLAGVGGTFVTLGTNGALTTGGDNSNTEFAGAISGTGGSLTKVGSGDFTLSGANSYTGTTTVRKGNLVAGAAAPSGSNGAFGSAISAIAIGDGSTGGTDNLGLLINGAFTVGRNVTVGNYGNVVTLGGTNTSGTATFGGTVTLSKNVNLTAAGGGTVDFSGDISGGFAVTKDGDGTVTFSTAKSYTGTTTIKAGMMLVNNTLASSSVIVQIGATLGGTGTIAGATTVDSGAKLKPGASIDTLTFSNGLTINGELDPEVSPLTSSDLLAITGDLTLGDFSILDVQGTLAGSNPAQQYTIATFTGSLKGTTGQFNTVKNNGTPGLPAGWSVQYNTHDIKVIPEPATMALLGLGGVAMLLGRRRSRKS
jgi:autotransporter-associated beta strand protein